MNYHVRKRVRLCLVWRFSTTAESEARTIATNIMVGTLAVSKWGILGMLRVDIL